MVLLYTCVQDTVKTFLTKRFSNVSLCTEYTDSYFRHLQLDVMPYCVQQAWIAYNLQYTALVTKVEHLINVSSDEEGS